MSAVNAALEAVHPFVLLLIAIASEICGTTALRLSAGFTKLAPVLVVAASYFVSFYLYALVLKRMPMGVAYAIWAGIGTAGVVLIGALVWRDQLSGWQLTGIGVIVVGAVMLNMVKAGP